MLDVYSDGNIAVLRICIATFNLLYSVFKGFFFYILVCVVSD